jgi:hypothetical protein
MSRAKKGRGNLDNLDAGWRFRLSTVGTTHPLGSTHRDHHVSQAVSQ